MFNLLTTYYYAIIQYPSPLERSLINIINFCGVALLIILTLYFSGCVNDIEPETTPKGNIDVGPELTQAEKDHLILLVEDYSVSEEEAKMEALDIARLLDAEDGKAGNQVVRTVDETIFLPIADTIQYPTHKNRPKDPGFYIFNFNDERGYAIISGDVRHTATTIGYSGNGHIDPNNSFIGINIVIKDAVRSLQHQRAEIEAMRGDETHIRLAEKIYDIDIPRQDKQFRTQGGICYLRLTPDYYGSCDRLVGLPDDDNDRRCYKIPQTIVYGRSIVRGVKVTPPIIKTEWDQDPPFNNDFRGGRRIGGCGGETEKCEDENGYKRYVRHISAGCVSIAEAQIIAHFYASDPNRWNGWRVIQKSGDCGGDTRQQRDTVARLVRNVFNQYGWRFGTCGPTGVWDIVMKGYNKRQRAIKPAFGLQTRKWRHYDKNRLLHSLRGNHPNLMFGFDEDCFRVRGRKIFCWRDITEAHEWIVDGLKEDIVIKRIRIRRVNRRTCSYYTEYTYSITGMNSLVHCNWGWGGPYDGNYYMPENFHATWGQQYRRGRRMITYIRPL